MDFEDAANTSDSQAVLAVEFNNQATLNHQGSEIIDELQLDEVANNW